ncbi:N-acetylmuramoyl-L-alanine amidase [Oceaniovalibus sp. ACAM 378]|uniref:peptidoglycan recognition protein family protein n=1 Tax=Oceaniovalibus sp. ACAM 378 TaxID=2599923 RepID=UPI0011D9B1B5|nr:N-acetylmuramoyl-L-alanine amidase [Oceaniovalibus sp. ACAM 378]TYB89737.1 N-acetylmuramoyl-L-alanine amidase [Oceaniovalibus sp. ACAM 378]
MDISCNGLIDRRGRNVRPRLARRHTSDLRAIVLHQTTGSTFLDDRNQGWLSSGSGEHRVDRISAHFVVLQNGIIYYTHDVEDYRSGSAGRGRGIDIEFAGRFPHGDLPDPAQRISKEMIRAGRNLVFALMLQTGNITHIHPHGQVQGRQRSDNSVCGGRDSSNPCGSLDNCPGPDIWVNIGQWCSDIFHLTCDTPLPGLGFPQRGIESTQSNPAYDLQVS